jgi:hypothetical protein
MNAEQPDFSNLQKTLRRFSPAPLPDALRRDLEAAAPTEGRTERKCPALPLQHRPASHVAPSPRADRILLLFTSTGLLAACLVAALTLYRLAAAPRPALASPQDLALQKQTVQEIERLIASR